MRTSLNVTLAAGFFAAGLFLMSSPASGMAAADGALAVVHQDTANGRPTRADSSGPVLQPVTGGALKCVGGKILTFECRNVELLSFLPLSAINGGHKVTDLWGWIDSATKREFVLVGRTGGTAFVEVTDPVNPRYLGELPLHANARSGTLGIKVYKNHAFIVAEATNNGMQVFDLTQLRDVKTPPVTFQETAHYDAVTSVHTLTLNEVSGFAYANAAGSKACGIGQHMIDVREPTRPSFAGCYINAAEGGFVGAGYVHDAQCVLYRGPDRRYEGREICLNAMGTGVIIVDVTDKRQPKTISAARYPNIHYAHQGWLTEDHRYFFLDDELDEVEGAGTGKALTRTLVFDLADLDDPVVLTEFYGTVAETDHNLYIRGRYMYQANYGAGLRIIDIADPKSPKEVGYLDPSPPANELFYGAWGNFPYFKDDVVAFTSQREGLFLVRRLRP